MPSISASTVAKGTAVAFDMLGSSMIIRRVTSPGTFNGETGAYDGRVVADRIVTGVIAGRERKWLRGELTTLDEYAVYVRASSAAAPANGEFMVLGSEEVAIQRVDAYEIKGTDIAYRVVLDK